MERMKAIKKTLKNNHPIKLYKNLPLFEVQSPGSSPLTLCVSLVHFYEATPYIKTSKTEQLTKYSMNKVAKIYAT